MTDLVIVLYVTSDFEESHGEVGVNTLTLMKSSLSELFLYLFVFTLMVLPSMLVILIQSSDSSLTDLK